MQNHIQQHVYVGIDPAQVLSMQTHFAAQAGAVVGAANAKIAGAVAVA